MNCPFSNARVNFATLPHHMRSLPVVRGFPVPWFVEWVGDQPEFRAMRPEAFRRAIKERLCWVCGNKIYGNFCFVAGPMCGINRTSSEPPSHPECGRWSAQNCPFLSRPNMVRREDGVINNESVKANSSGLAITRNPGVAMLWFTRSYKLFNDGRGGVLFEMGAPLMVEWWKESRRATRDEVQHSIDGGLPSLESVARTEDGGLEALAAHVKAFRRWLPKKEQVDTHA